MATATVSRPRKRTRTVRPKLNLHSNPQSNPQSLDIVESTDQNTLSLSDIMRAPPESWEAFDIAQTGTPSDFLPPTSDYEFLPSHQAEDSFSEFLSTGATFATPRSDQSTWDGLDRRPHLAAESVAPQDLTSVPGETPSRWTDEDLSPVSPVATDPSPGTIDAPKKRGRKRRQLDAVGQAVERKKFLERNRVAANKCRERKKSFVNNLEHKYKDTASKNKVLRTELQTLKQEVSELRQMSSVQCSCTEELLTQNLFTSLSEMLQSESDIAEVMAKFKSLRPQRLRARSGIDDLLREIKLRTPSTASSLSTQDDDIFSLVGDLDGGSSSPSSPIDLTDSIKFINKFA